MNPTSYLRAFTTTAMRRTGYRQVKYGFYWAEGAGKTAVLEHLRLDCEAIGINSLLIGTCVLFR